MSESEEMYLITIARIMEGGLDSPIPLSRLAEDLSVVPVSVNQMVKKLESAGLVHYQPYKGVALTAAGQEVALQVLRHRRLWEFFLVEHLDLSAQKADELACRMEHITSQEVADRLASYLGNPQLTPDGKRIPGKDEKVPLNPTIPLSSLEVGQIGKIKYIKAEDRVQSFLESEGITRGVEVRILARGANGSFLLELAGTQVSLSPEVALAIQVQGSSQISCILVS